jgi:hypothetical protein
MFLYDPDIWSNLGNRHIWVHFGVDYDGGRQANRCARTRVPSRFIGPDGPVRAQEVSLMWTDNKSQFKAANVDVRYLFAAAPKHKDKEGIILSGNAQGTLVVVKKYTRKTKLIQVSAGDLTWEEPEGNVCWVEVPK